MPTTNGGVFIATSTPRLYVSTKTYGGGVTNVGVMTSSNVVVSNDNLDRIVLYSSGAVMVNGAIVSTQNYWNANGANIYNNNSGKVGVGTPSPGSVFTVLQAGNGVVLSSYTGNGNADTLNILDGVNGGQGFHIYTLSNTPLGFSTNNSGDKLTIDTSGNVGIGTTKQGVPFSVAAVSNGVFLATFSANGGADTLGIFDGSNGQQGMHIYTPSKTPLGFSSNNNGDLLVLSTTNFVGIGNTVPSWMLEIGKGSALTGGGGLRINGVSGGYFFLSFAEASVDEWVQYVNNDKFILRDNVTPANIITMSSTTSIEYGGPAPSVSACGAAPAGSVVGNNHVGIITVGGGTVTSCVLTFVYPLFTNAPICMITTGSSSVTGGVTSSATSSITIGLSANLGSGSIYYNCLGYR